MIRVYLDSDVINSIKDGLDNNLSEFIESNRGRIITPISPAHISDKLPSKTHPKFKGDLDFLTKFSEKQVMQFDGQKKSTSPHLATAWDILEFVESSENLFSDEDLSDLFSITNYEDSGIEPTEELIEMDKKIETLLNTELYDFQGNEVTFQELMVGLMTKFRDYEQIPEKYKENRDEIWGQFKLPSHAGSWSENVIDKINVELKSAGKEDFLTMSSPPDNNEKLQNAFSAFINAYLNFNTLGYKPDDISKNKGFRNHFNDASHAFYGGNCDYFVVKDKKMYPKAKALYDAFNVSTKVVTVEEFLLDCNNILIEDSSDIGELSKSINNDQPIDYLIEEGYIKHLFRLEGRMFDYFTHVQTEKPIGNNEGVVTVMLMKQLNNYSDFMFYSEHDTVFRKVHEVFGGGIDVDQELEKFKAFYVNKKIACKEYFLPFAYVILECTGAKFFLTIILKSANNGEDT